MGPHDLSGTPPHSCQTPSRCAVGAPSLTREFLTPLRHESVALPVGVFAQGSDATGSGRSLAHRGVAALYVLLCELVVVK